MYTWVKYINSVVITDREHEVETSRHLISIRLYFILTILITEDDHNHIFF
jgi:hypothetical protein